jgi:hypothetical protein
VLRLETIKREYAELAVDEALLADIADLWTRAERRERAERALAELETKYPRSERLTALWWTKTSVSREAIAAATRSA